MDEVLRYGKRVMAFVMFADVGSVLVCPFVRYLVVLDENSPTGTIESQFDLTWGWVEHVARGLSGVC